MKPLLPVGIDLGTTFSAIAHIDHFGQPMVIPNGEGELTTPSVILFEDDRVVVGTAALQNAIAEPERVVEFVKREMGKGRADFSRKFGDREYSAEELSSLILRKLKQDAEKRLGGTIEDAVVTVPAYFNDPERTATIHAGELAGLNVLQVLNEPTAAALAYGISRLTKDQTVFVFDLGGGTLDVTLMKVEKGGIRMLATNGDHRLGGKDWDDVLVNLVAEEFDKQHGANPLLDLRSYQELHTRAVAAKIQLSRRREVLLVHSHGGASVRREVTRDEFEQRAASLVERCRSLCEMVIGEAGLGWDAVDNILLVGGMTRMPMVREMIRTLGDRPIAEGVNPDEAVAQGAAIQAMLCRFDKEKKGGGPARARIALPEAARTRFTGNDGALVEVRNITSHTLGLVLWDESRLESYVFPMIRKMTPYPVEVENAFGTAAPNLERVVVHIVEGESTVPEECTVLGTCEIELPPYLPKGAPVSLIYRYNENQVLEVVIRGFGKEAVATVKRGTGMQDADLVRARADLALLKVD